MVSRPCGLPSIEALGRFARSVVANGAHLHTNAATRRHRRCLRESGCGGATPHSGP